MCISTRNMSKRLRAGEGSYLEALPAKKANRQAIITTQAAATQSILLGSTCSCIKHKLISSSIERNTSRSPLLRLPSELRQEIFRLVIGDKFIHVDFVTSPFEGEPPGGFHHSVCGGAVSLDEAYEEFRSGFDDVPSHDSPEFYSTPFWKRHDHYKP